MMFVAVLRDEVGLKQRDGKTIVSRAVVADDE
jgi:hypothetical protein